MPSAIDLPTLALPPAQIYQTPSLDQPVADIPSYTPLVVPPSDLKPPKGVKSKTEEKTEQPVTPKIDIPYFNFEVPLPTTEVVMAATYAAVSAVAVTTFAQPFLTQLRKNYRKQYREK